MSENTTSLCVRRGQLKAALTRFWSYIQSDTRDDKQIEIRRLKIEDTWNDFQQVQSQIEANGDALKNEKEHIIYREEFEDLYYTAVTAAENITNPSKEEKENKEDFYRVSQNSSEINQVSSIQPMIKLSTLKVPIFSGKYEEWASFHDMYTAVIHENKGLTTVQKFFYLRSSLSDDAANCIKCLATTEANYAAAWASLVKRYSNKKILVQTHVRNIVDIQVITECTSVKLRQFSDTFTSNIKALETLEEKPSEWSPLLLHLLCAKLDSETLKAWEIQSPKDKIPHISELVVFLEDRFQIIEAIESSKNITKNILESTTKKNTKYKGAVTRSAAFTTATMKCYVCSDTSHSIYKCPTFIALSVVERIQKITSLKHCKICLRKHENKCSARHCFKCGRSHNTLLHLSKESSGKGDGNNQEINKNSEIAAVTPTSSITAHAQTGFDRVLLATAVVRVYAPSGKSSLARVLLDSASMNNFVSMELVQSLGIKREKINHIVSGIGEATQNITSSAFLKIQSCISDFTLNTNSLVVPKITGDLPTRMITENVPRPKNITLADQYFKIPQKIDVLIGAAHFYDIIGAQQYRPCVEGPIYQETKFGFVVSGLIPDKTNKEKTITCVNENLKYEDSGKLENLMRQFWQIEEYNSPSTYTLEEKACCNHFNNTVSRDDQGRFVVQLPFRENLSQLGKSYTIAKRRLLAIERRFEKNPKFKSEYVKFMREYETLNHMKYINDEEIDLPGNMCYLAHHGVINENSLTTKLRVVFDASTKTETGVSLNDVLLKGPAIQDELIYILTRFRTHNFVITADIKKMYRQINIVDKHRDFQRILWRENINDPIKTYQLNTITYGTVPASYLATACLKKLSELKQNHYPDIAPIIARDFYMDDFLGGAATKQAAIALRDNLIAILNTACLELGKWSSNDPGIIDNVRDRESENKVTDLQDVNNTITKILGLYWNASTDNFQYKLVSDIECAKQTRITKREILSDIARIYDPLGLIGPIIIRAKLILQSLWKEQINWSELVPDSVLEEWHKYKKDLLSLNNLKIPRQITITQNYDIQVHGFADASILAYGCCIYLRCSNAHGKHFSSLICAKSKVAPLKALSLPRLELCAALLLARVANKIIPKINLPITKVYYWSDSQVTLCWVTSPSQKWKTFVAHRVGQIQDLTSTSNWRHISGAENPADIISRGCSPSELSSKDIWWHGPNWLLQDESECPIYPIKGNIENIPEEKSKSVSAICTTEDKLNIITKYSSMGKLLRIIAYCLRFKTNSLGRDQKVTGILHPDEIKSARISLIKLVQEKEFSREIQQLLKNEDISSKSKLWRLRPFLDENGIIRVGGRLKNASSISVFQRNPIVLPSHNAFTNLILRNEHESLMHGGPQAVLSSIRMNYWPINGRNLARNVVNSCVICFRQKPVVVQPIMGNLPADRVEPGRAFLKCGIDFAGPLMVKTGTRKNSPVTKSYVCVFICLATRAVHLELVNDLSTAAFIRALNRFFDRRGKSLTIYSDNATNFVGANRELQEWFKLFGSAELQQKTGETLADVGVEWKFIPARSPHFGGLWEAGVKSMKSLLRKVLGNAYFSYEELLTIITRAEACLNSRPITFMSSDPKDMTHLTPGHFLIGDSLSALPEIDETNIPTNRLTRWRRVSQYSRNLWKRWSREYLSQLQERSRWAVEKGPRLKMGSVVLMKDDNLPPLKWRLGRVISLIPGDDGVIRVADVQMVGGTFRRAVRQLCPLSFEGNRTENLSI